VLRRQPSETAIVSPGSNHVALRAANERLVLSLIRSHGELSKAQIAELSGLTAQTASVISRSLVDAGLLVAGNPVRGKVGQPFVPLRLNPQGAMFLGLHIDAREAHLALVDFTGQVVTETSLALDGPNLRKVMDFTRAAIDAIRADYNADQNARIQGLGASITSGALGDNGARMSWQEIDETFAALGRQLGIATYASTDAVAACSAELIYGLGGGLSDFAYVFIDDSVTGGLVQDGHIHFSRDGTGANMGKVLVPDSEARMVPLRTLAAAAQRKASITKDLDLLARGIAFAAHSASAVVRYSAVIVDGAIPIENLSHISAKLRSLLAEFVEADGLPLAVREGSHARRRRPSAQPVCRSLTVSTRTRPAG
jgi:predicted NBD/HSP70 family sugar kinase